MWSSRRIPNVGSISADWPSTGSPMGGPRTRVWYGCKETRWVALNCERRDTRSETPTLPKWLGSYGDVMLGTYCPEVPRDAPNETRVFVSEYESPADRYP